MKVYRKEEEIISLVEEMCDWLIKESEQGRKVFTKKLSDEFGVPKTTVLRWVDKYTKQIPIEKYEKVHNILAKNDKKSKEKRKEINKRTLEIAQAILSEENKDKPVYKVIEELGYDRKRSMNLIYDNLYKIDKTEYHDYYLEVLRQILKNSNHLTKARELISKVDEENLNKKYDSLEELSDISIEKKILIASTKYLRGESLESLARYYKVSVKDIIIAFEDVLPNIDFELSGAVIEKLSNTSKINHKENNYTLRKIG